MFGVQLQQVNQCPLFVQLCLFNRLIRAIQYHLQIAQNKLCSNGNDCDAVTFFSIGYIFICFVVTLMINCSVNELDKTYTARRIVSVNKVREKDRGEKVMN